MQLLQCSKAEASEVTVSGRPQPERADCYMLQAESDGRWRWFVLDERAEVLRSGFTDTRTLAERQVQTVLTRGVALPL